MVFEPKLETLPLSSNHGARCLICKWYSIAAVPCCFARAGGAVGGKWTHFIPRRRKSRKWR